MILAAVLQVRLWNVARSQQEILGSMRDPSGVASQPGLAGYWKFDDVDRCVRIQGLQGSRRRAYTLMLCIVSSGTPPRCNCVQGTAQAGGSSSAHVLSDPAPA